MSQADVEVIREAFDRWNSGDIGYELHEVSADEVCEVGAKLLVLGSVRSRGKTSGTELRHPFGWVRELRDGELVRMHFYSSHTDALTAVGLSK